MKVISAEIRVEAEEGVTPQMIRSILVNHLYFAFSETAGGIVRWDKVSVTARDVRPEK